MLIKLLLFISLCTFAYADNPPERIYDEGVLKGVAYNLNCVGAGIECTQSGVTGTITVSSGGSGNVGIGSTMIDGTAGSVLFVGAGPVFAQDNANLYWDDTYNGLYLSRSTPTRPAKLLIYRKSTDVIGTVSTTATSGTVTGSGTIFQTQVFVGDKIVVNGETRTVLTVPSDTSLTTDAWTSSNTDQSYSLRFVGAGRVSTTSGSGTVTGTGTAFLQDVAVGDTIEVNGETRTVSAIASNTSLTTDNWSASNTTQTYLQTVQRVASVNYSTINTRNLTISKDSVDSGGTGLFNATNTVAQTSTSTNTAIQATSFAANMTIGARNTNNWTDTPGLTTMNVGMFTTAGATGTVTNFESIRSRFNFAATGMTVTNAKLYTVGPISNSGTITNTYGYYAGDITTGTQTNTPYSFYAEDTNAIGMYSAGNIGIGSLTPGSLLDIASAGGLQSRKIATTSSNAAYESIGDGTNSLLIGTESDAGAGIFTGGLANASVIGSNSTNALQLATNNAVRMTVDSSGNVGIADTTPSFPLDVTGKIRSTSHLIGTNFLYLDGAGSSAYWAWVGGDMLSDKGINIGGGVTTTGGYTQSGTNVNYFSGNVGIGTASPTATYSGANLNLKGANSNIRLDTVGAAGAWSYLDFFNSGASKYSLGYTSTAAYDVFKINAGSSLDTANGLTINSSNNVGIGSSSPAQPLDVNGIAKATTFIATPSANPVIYSGSDSNTGLVLPSADVLHLQTGGTNAITVNATQNVGIGTSAPGAVLDVNGHSRFKTAGFLAEVDDGNSSTADTIDWTTGNRHKSTMTGNCTYTFTAPTTPTAIGLKLIQDGTGSRTATWPAAVKWPGGTAPTLTTTAAAVDYISCFYDGTNYLCNSSLDVK